MTAPVLANGLHRGFLQSSTRNNVKFAIMWANQDVCSYLTSAAVLARLALHRFCPSSSFPPPQWSDIQPAKRGVPSPTQFFGAVDNVTFTLMTQYWIDNYLLVRRGTRGMLRDSGTHCFQLDRLKLPNYYRVPDLSTASPDRVCALVNVYEIDVLINGLGGVSRGGKAEEISDGGASAFSAVVRYPRATVPRPHCSCLQHPRRSRLFAPLPRPLAFPASIYRQKGSD